MKRFGRIVCNTGQGDEEEDAERQSNQIVNVKHFSLGFVGSSVGPRTSFSFYSANVPFIYS